MGAKADCILLLKASVQKVLARSFFYNRAIFFLIFGSQLNASAESGGGSS